LSATCRSNLSARVARSLKRTTYTKKRRPPSPEVLRPCLYKLGHFWKGIFADEAVAAYCSLLWWRAGFLGRGLVMHFSPTHAATYRVGLPAAQKKKSRA
jgi:hypothetical protein